MAEKYYELGQKERAKENYQKVIEIFEYKTPDHRKNANNYCFYAISLAGMGMNEQALGTVVKAMEIYKYSSPDDQSIGHFLHWNKAYILALSGEADKALELWNF